MDKLDNYIFYTICDKSVDCFKETNFVTYRNFCDNIKVSLEQGELSNNYIFIIYEISKFIDKIYCLGSDESLEYVTDFFVNERYKVFDEAVLMEKEFFKNSFN